MNHYLDTSVLLALIVRDRHSATAFDWFARIRPYPVVSSFAATEFSAVISRHVRANQMSATEGTDTLNIFDVWLERNATVVPIHDGDVVAATKMVRNFDSKLLAPDALHLSISNRVGNALVTFDKRLAAAAQLQGMAAIVPN